MANDEGRESKMHLEGNEVNSPSHKRSDSSSSDSSLRSIVFERDALTDSFIKSKQSDPEIEISDNPHIASMSAASVTPSTVSPQMMGRPVGYDPARIPASVFSSKPSTPMEWSVASNESLFSIHIGNSSFSKDQFYLKSGELPRLDELPSNQPTEAVNSTTESKKVDSSPSVEQTKAGSNESAEGYSNNRMPPIDEASISPRSPEAIGSSASPRAARKSASLHSDGSVNSTLSFAFPVLADDGGKDGTTKTEKVEKTPGQQTQSDNSPATPPTAHASWFSCFSCCTACR